METWPLSACFLGRKTPLGLRVEEAGSGVVGTATLTYRFFLVFFLCPPVHPSLPFIVLSTLPPLFFLCILFSRPYFLPSSALLTRLPALPPFPSTPPSTE